MTGGNADITTITDGLPFSRKLSKLLLRVQFTSVATRSSDSPNRPLPFRPVSPKHLAYPLMSPNSPPPFLPLRYFQGAHKEALLLLVLNTNRSLDDAALQ